MNYDCLNCISIGIRAKGNISGRAQYTDQKLEMYY